MRPDDHTLATIGRMLRAGLYLFPLSPRSKSPRDEGGEIADYSQSFEFYCRWLEHGGNVGARASRRDLIVDVDPANGGDASWNMLRWEVGLDGLRGVPVVQTGGAGFHYYFHRPAGARLRASLPGYPGIVFHSLGSYVVAPGSIHPSGVPYRLKNARFPLHIPEAPGLLLSLLKVPESDALAKEQEE